MSRTAEGMVLGDVLVRWTVRGSMILYGFALALRAAARTDQSQEIPNVTANAARPNISNAARLAWTAGCALLIAHVFCAFAFVHHWSHDDAYATTARRTAETVGLDWGGGIYANYLFVAVWAADALWWRISPASYESRSRSVEWVIQIFLAFIAFNATVVFALGPVRYFFLAAALILVGTLAWLRWRWP